ncbi:glycoside hydrolase family 38 C-terminal domain-containing protein [Allorhizocola rhizosphaerae]|uniref:glycoside hydrolase family 38 N-terminal domain-containing protein n=1 Tax=Allorhizocola rhizosphaerae TaxID=1872709 RepID=UPI000E3D9EF8|nr:glycoside hydrolase family 38 C-terminal domain-containing protein [Allorhizocola rhizosphaerae]
MTTRLLRASLGSPTYDDMRATLRPTFLPPLRTDRGVEVHAQVLPLFRDGKQAVRVNGMDHWVPEVSAPTRVTLTLDEGNLEIEVTPQRKWTVYVVHHSHLDIGYTDRQGVVLRNHLEYLDSALELATATDDWPDDARFRWNVESALPVRTWLGARASSVVDRFVQLAKQGRIEVTAMPYQLHTEACSVEELHRLLRFTDDLRTEYGIPITSAMHTDVPGAVAGFVDALASGGVKYLSAAHNWAGRSVPFLHGGLELGRPFWWRSPSGNRVMVWFTDTPHGMAYMEGNVVGLNESFALTQELLPGYLDALANRPVPYQKEAFGWSGLDSVDRPGYPHDILHLRVQGGHADNATPSIVPPSVVREWNATYDWPKLKMATNTAFFEDAVARIGDRIPEHEGDWTDWWADGLGSGARPLGYARRAQHAIRHAETLHTLADSHLDADAVYDKLGLFDEHTWGAANPWHDHEDGFDSGGLQWARKSELAYSAFDDAEDLRHAGARRLGARFAPGNGALASYLVFNPGLSRSDTVSAFLPSSTVALGRGLSLVDSRTGRVIPHHEEIEDWATRPHGRRITFTVADVPSVGAVRVDVVRGDGPTAPGELATELENEFYRVEFDLKSGVIASIFDKRTGRELVNVDAYAGMNQYVYDRYSTTGHVNHLSGHIEASGTHHLSLLSGRSLGRRASIVRATRTAAGQTLEVQLDGDGVDWLRTTIFLPTDVPRVDITNRILKQGAPVKESVFFAFPFAAGAPTAWELTGGVGGPNAPIVPGAASHMTPIRHWVSFADGAGWATLEAPLVMFGELYLPYSPFPPTVKPSPAEPGTVYSWALNNIWDTNFPAQQQGETTFRYAIAEDGPTAAAGLTDPFLAIPLTGRDRTPEELYFAQVNDPRVEISSIGRSRRGHDLVVYLRCTEPVTTQVRLPYPVRAAYLGTSLERDLQPVDLDAVPVPGTGLTALVVDL